MTDEQYIMAIRQSLDKNRSKIFLRRSPAEVNINNYNIRLLGLHRANMDIQFVLDPFACVKYILSYINKANRGMSKLLRETVAEINARGNITIREKLKIIAKKFLNSSEISAQEAVFYLLALEVSKTSRDVLFINTSPPEGRVRMVRPERELRNLPPNSTDVFSTNINDYYRTRPRAIADLALAQVAANFSFKKKARVAPLDDDDDDDDDDEAHQQAFMNVFGIDADELARQPANGEANIDFEAIFDAVLADQVEVDNGAEIDFDGLHDAVRGAVADDRIDVDAINDALDNADDEDDQQADVPEENDEEFNCLVVFHRRLLGFFAGTATARIEPGTDPNQDLEVTFRDHREEIFNIFNQFSPGDNEEQLDADFRAEEERQRLEEEEPQPEQAVADGFAHLDPPEEIEHEDVSQQIGLQGERAPQAPNLEPPPRHEHKSGVGKSFLIECIYQAAMRYYDHQPNVELDKLRVLLCAPTGKAALNIRGMTLNSAFGIPVSQNNRPLSADIANTLRVTFSQLKLIIIDEVSMVGLSMLSKVDTRLRQIMGVDELYGNLPVIVLGDFNQLRPVIDRICSFAFQPFGGDRALAGTVLRDPFSYFRLDQVMRQENAVFAQALNNLAVGRLTPAEVALFEGRVIRDPAFVFPQGTIHLFKTNELVDAFNTLTVQNMRILAPPSIAAHLCTGTAPERTRQQAIEGARNKAARDAQGLPPSLEFREGARYMMTVNIATSDGLVNGASGTLQRVTIDNNSNTAVIMWIDFGPPDVGAQARIRDREEARAHGVPENLTPVRKETRQLSTGRHNNYQLTRTQFPMVLGEAITIHKSQGASFTNVAVHLSHNLPSTELYIELPSIHPDLAAQTNDVEVEFRRLQALPPFCTLPTWPAGNTLKIIYHNVEGLASKFESTFADSTFSDADVVIFSETRVPITTNYDFERYGFRQVNRIAGTGRHGSGTVVAVRAHLEAEAFAPVIGGNVADREADSRASRMEICSVVVRGIFISGVYISPNAAYTVIRRYLRVANFNSDFMQNHDPRLLNGALRHHNLQIRTPAETPTTDMRTQLDLVFAYPILNVQAMVYESVTSYHKPVMASVDLGPRQPLAQQDNVLVNTCLIDRPSTSRASAVYQAFAGLFRRLRKGGKQEETELASAQQTTTTTSDLNSQLSSLLERKDELEQAIKTQIAAKSELQRLRAELQGESQQQTERHSGVPPSPATDSDSDAHSLSSKTESISSTTQQQIGQKSRSRLVPFHRLRSSFRRKNAAKRTAKRKAELQQQLQQQVERNNSRAQSSPATDFLPPRTAKEADFQLEETVGDRVRRFFRRHNNLALPNFLPRIRTGRQTQQPVRDRVRRFFRRHNNFTLSNFFPRKRTVRRKPHSEIRTRGRVRTFFRRHFGW
ncbi:hypothetical protein TYRP_023493 [Tyrophagus putrescentiae]|nr:hypothetical protein TYRP_023493 [Tyrophagus putrescentiae]